MNYCPIVNFNRMCWLTEAQREFSHLLQTFYFETIVCGYNIYQPIIDVLKKSNHESPYQLAEK